MLVALLLQCRIRGERVAMRKIKKVFENIKPRFGLSILRPKGISKGPKVTVIPVWSSSSLSP